jgi:hypothetical protein
MLPTLYLKFKLFPSFFHLFIVIHLSFLSFYIVLCLVKLSLTFFLRLLQALELFFSVNINNTVELSTRVFDISIILEWLSKLWRWRVLMRKSEPFSLNWLRLLLESRVSKGRLSSSQVFLNWGIFEIRDASTLLTIQALIHDLKDLLQLASFDLLILHIYFLLWVLLLSLLFSWSTVLLLSLHSPRYVSIHGVELWIAGF